ncbi:MAG: efflux RND transporter periplasmic adaptor subunit [Novosphingobium sp.]
MNYDAKISPVGGEREIVLDPLTENDEDDRRSRRRLWIIAAVVLVALIAVWFVMHRGGDKALAGSGAAQAPVVTVITPGRASIAGAISATGTLAARREMPVGSVGEGGAVISVLVEPGQWVRAGQALAVVDSSVQTQQAAALGAQIRVADADARLAQANLERALKLVSRGFISTADVDRLTATRDAANARVNVARAQLSEARARNRRLSIVAPAAGLVLERHVEPGQVVSGGSTVLFKIARDGQIEMLAKLSEDDLAKISPGVAAAVTPVGSPRSFDGQVWQISPVIDPQSRLGVARIALSYSPELRPGGFASARIDAGSVVAPLLPESAVLSDTKGSYVYVVNGDNKVVRRDIGTGALGSDGIAVIRGLSGSERVVLRAGAFLAEGETVKPRTVRR